MHKHLLECFLTWFGSQDLIILISKKKEKKKVFQISFWLSLICEHSTYCLIFGWNSLSGRLWNTIERLFFQFILDSICFVADFLYKVILLEGMIQLPIFMHEEFYFSFKICNRKVDASDWKVMRFKSKMKCVTKFLKSKILILNESLISISIYWTLNLKDVRMRYTMQYLNIPMY